MLARFAIVAVLALCVGSVATARAQEAPPIPAFDHIFIILMENRGDNEIAGDVADAPYLNQLAGQYAVATNYSAVAHPSLPNYLALVGGDTFGINSDCTTCFLNAPNIVADRIVGSGRTWKAYMESLPSTCFTGDAYPYAQKHDPFVYFDDIRTSAECQNVVQLDALAADLSAPETTPAYGWITPNLCSDMHDCSMRVGDKWLSAVVPQILGSPAFTAQNSLLLIVWDEDDGSDQNRVPLLLVGPSVIAGARSDAAYNHYSVLKTIEVAWGLAPLTSNDASAMPISDVFVTS